MSTASIRTNKIYKQTFEYNTISCTNNPIVQLCSYISEKKTLNYKSVEKLEA